MTRELFAGVMSGTSLDGIDLVDWSDTSSINVAPPPELLEVLAPTASEVALARSRAMAGASWLWPGDGRVPFATVGVIASADVWTQSVERLDVIHGLHETLCEDMEAAAAGRIAQLYGLPFLAVKDISNNEYLQSSDLFDFTDFPVEEVGKRAAAVIAALAAELGARELVTC